MKVSQIKATELYNDYLNENNQVMINGIEYDAAEVLKDTDPIAYRVGESDFLDSEELEIE